MKCELCKDTGFINGFNCIACNATTQPVHPCRVGKIVPKYESITYCLTVDYTQQLRAGTTTKS